MPLTTTPLPLTVPGLFKYIATSPREFEVNSATSTKSRYPAAFVSRLENVTLEALEASVTLSISVYVMRYPLIPYSEKREPAAIE